MMETNKCRVCGKTPLSRDEMGMTKKLIDKQAVKFYCLPCLAKFIEADEAELVAKLREFKAEGCTLFT